MFLEGWAEVRPPLVASAVRRMTRDWFLRFVRFRHGLACERVDASSGCAQRGSHRDRGDRWSLCELPVSGRRQFGSPLRPRSSEEVATLEHLPARVLSGVSFAPSEVWAVRGIGEGPSFHDYCCL